MNIDHWKNNVPSNFSDESSVWIYQSSRLITMDEQESIQQQINIFTSNWLSHKNQVQGWGTVLFNYFIILMADESVTQVSGCSKDSMMHFIQLLEKEYKIKLFNRTVLAFLHQNKIENVDLSLLPQKIQTGDINLNTIYFNNTITTKKQLLNEWIVELQYSWLKKNLII